jgi:hypothetical protein
MWRFLTIFPPNMATFATKFRKNLFGQLARDFLKYFVAIQKFARKKERKTLLPSSYGWMTTGRRLWNQKKKIYIYCLKNICDEISQLGEFVKFFKYLKT